MKNYYEILEVNEKASIETIKRVFKMQIKRNHPDLFTGIEKEKAEAKVKELNEAYDILSDETKKAEYDYNLNIEKSNKNMQKEIDFQNTINNLKAELQRKDQIIEHFLGNIDLSEFSPNQANVYDDITTNQDINNNSNHIRFRDSIFNIDNNVNSQQSFYNDTNNLNNTTKYYKKIFINILIRIIVLVISIIILLIGISTITHINIFDIIIDTFSK